jgi:glucose/arabinose dehydrogenase
MTLLRGGLVAVAVVLAGCGTDATTAEPDPTLTSPTSEQEAREDSPSPDPLAPGRWLLEVNGDHTNAPWAEVEVPEGYEVTLREHGDNVGAAFAGGPFIFGVDDPATEEVTRAVGYWTVSGVHRDPCAKTGLRDPGPTVVDLAGALVDQRLTTATAPVP